MVWEAADRICGKRLKELLPTLLDAMGRHGHLDLIGAVQGCLLAMSAATMDRALADTRSAAGRNRRRSTPSSAVKRVVPIRSSVSCAATAQLSATSRRAFVFLSILSRREGPCRSLTNSRIIWLRGGKNTTREGWLHEALAEHRGDEIIQGSLHLSRRSATKGLSLSVRILGRPHR